MTSPKLISQPSDGPREHPQRNGLVWVQSTPCPVCRGAIVKGQPITYFDGRWAHGKCVSDHLLTVGSAGAWLTLGAQLARYPRAFKAAETKVIVGQLLRMAGQMEPDDYRLDEEYPVAKP